MAKTKLNHDGANHPVAPKDKPNCDLILYAVPPRKIDSGLTWKDACRRWHELKAAGISTFIVRDGELMHVPTKTTHPPHSGIITALTTG
jgi:hypothetical protein